MFANVRPYNDRLYFTFNKLKTFCIYLDRKSVHPEKSSQEQVRRGRGFQVVLVTIGELKTHARIIPESDVGWFISHFYWGEMVFEG